MCEVQYFKAAKQTNRFNANQKVWVRLNMANCLYVWYKYRGSGRYVSGTCDKFANYVGEIKSMQVDDDFGNRIKGIGHR